MIRLLLVELTRLRVRRTVALLLLGTVAITMVIGVVVLANLTQVKLVDAGGLQPLLGPAAQVATGGLLQGVEQVDQLVLYLGAALWILMAALDSSVATAGALLE